LIQGEGKFFELVRCDDNDDWLAQRKKGIGGSDVAAIMGLSKYKGAYALWMEKTGQIDAEDISDKPAVHWGNVLEPVVGAEYSKAHPDRRIRRVNAVCKSIKRPWAQASLDYEVRDPELGWGILEIKTAGLRSADDWSEGVPLYYQTQIMHYMSVTGRDFADVAVLIGGSDYREYRIIRDDDDIASVDAKVDEFWVDNVLGGAAPEISGLDSDSRAVFQRNTSGNGEIVEADDLKTTVEEYEAVANAMKSLEQRKKQLANTIKERIGANKGLKTEKNTVYWTRSKTKRLDTKRLGSEMPEIAAQYTKECDRDGGIRVYTNGD